MCPDTEQAKTYTCCEPQNKTAEDFTISMQINNKNFEIARESSIAQFRVLLSQGVITEATFQTLCQPITDMRHYFTATECGYYEMRNILEEYEKKNKKC